MNRTTLKVWTGASRPTLRGLLALGLAGTALLGGATIRREHAGTPSGAAREQDTAQQQEHAAAVLAALRGAQPLACRLAIRALENRWGSNQGDVPGPESIGAAGDAAFAWATGGEIGPSAMPALKAALADADGCVPRIAAVLLGHARSPGLAAELGNELASSSTSTRQAALLAIGYAGERPDVRAASNALDDPDFSVRLTAVWALGRIGDPAAVPSLLKVLKATDPALRAAAAAALGNTESSDAIPALAAALGSDSDARVRRAAAAALGRIDQ